MSQLFRRPSSHAATGDSRPVDPISGYSSLLNPVSSIEPVEPPHHHRRRRRTRSSSTGWPSLGITSSGGGSHPHLQESRPWLSAAEARPSWTGERPPTRKLVKEPGSGSARPSFSVELSDSDDDKDKGFFRRSFDRLKDLYRRNT